MNIDQKNDQENITTKYSSSVSSTKIVILKKCIEKIMHFSVTYSKNKKKSTGHALKPKYYKKKWDSKIFFTILIMENKKGKNLKN